MVRCGEAGADWDRVVIKLTTMRGTFSYGAIGSVQGYACLAGFLSGGVRIIKILNYEEISHKGK